MFWLRTVIGALLAALLIAAVGCAPADKGTVSVLYAGSLVSVMEHSIGPAFDQATGYKYQGEGKGSVALANLIKGKIRTPDIYISADPTVNALLMGPANGNYVQWFLTMARTTMVIGWSSKSRFAAKFEQARANQIPWYQVLETPGLQLGRTDPALDPKGYRSLWLFDLAERYYNRSGLRTRILGQDENPAQIFPEEELVARLEAGQLDAGIFYLNEVVEQNLPYLNLPDEINQGDPAQAALYAQVSYTSKKGEVFHGSPILYTIAIPSTSRNTNGATAFVQFLLGAKGQQILKQHGLLSTEIDAGGDASAVPRTLETFVKGRYATPVR